MSVAVPTEIFNDTDVEYVRVLLGQAGRFNQIIENNEPQIAISPNKIYTNFNDITDVIGIWSGTDYNHSGTNMALSGTFDSKKGIIYAESGTTPFTMGGDYLVSYVHGDGLTDRDITRCLDDADAQIKLYLYTRDEVNYDTSTVIGKIAYALKINLAALHGLSILNTGNIIQSGFNYSLGDLRIETKLWGEGMSAEPLIRIIIDKIKEMIYWLRLYYHEGKSVIQLLDRTKGEGTYHNKRLEHLVKNGTAKDWVMDGITLSRQFKVVDD